MKHLSGLPKVVGILIFFVVAVNVIWWLAPLLGDPAIYRLVFIALLVVVADQAWRQMRRER